MKIVLVHNCFVSVTPTGATPSLAAASLAPAYARTAVQSIYSPKPSTLTASELNCAMVASRTFNNNDANHPENIRPCSSQIRAARQKKESIICRPTVDHHTVATNPHCASCHIRMIDFVYSQKYFFIIKSVYVFFCQTKFFRCWIIHLRFSRPIARDCPLAPIASIRRK